MVMPPYKTSLASSHHPRMPKLGTIGRWLNAAPGMPTNRSIAIQELRTYDLQMFLFDLPVSECRGFSTEQLTYQKHEHPTEICPRGWEPRMKKLLGSPLFMGDFNMEGDIDVKWAYPIALVLYPARQKL